MLLRIFLPVKDVKLNAISSQIEVTPINCVVHTALSAMSEPVSTESTPLLVDSRSINNLRSSNNSYRYIVFALALLCCFSANSLGLFTVFAPELKRTLGYSSYQLNIILTCTSLGGFLTVPVLGSVADKYGTGTLGAMAAALFTPGYLVAAHVVQNNLVDEFGVMVTAFTVIALGTSALYFCGVLTCAKVIPDAPGLAIAAPVTCFGLSALCQSQLVQLFLKNDNTLNLVSLFRFYATIYFVIGFIGYFIGVRKIDTDIEDPVLRQAEGASENYSLWNFFTGRTVFIFYIAFVLIAGPMNMYLGNLGLILETVPELSSPSEITKNLSLFSAFSTVSRLLTGLLSDVLQPYIPRQVLLILVLNFLCGLQFFMSAGLFTVVKAGHYFALSTSLFGFGYGAMYTLMPTIIATTWGLEHLGAHWGMFVTAPAVGSPLFGYLFSSVYAAGQNDKGECIGKQCYSLTFMLTGFSGAISVCIVFLIWMLVWSRKPTIADPDEES